MADNDGLGPRWSEGARLGLPGEDRAAELFAVGAQPPRAVAPLLDRVWTRLNAGERWARARRVWWMRPAVAFGLVLAGLGGAAASVALTRRFAAAPAPPPQSCCETGLTRAKRLAAFAGQTPSAALAPVARKAADPEPASGEAALPAPPSLSTEPGLPVVRKKGPAPRRLAPAAVPPTAPSAADAHTRETRLFREALAKLRGERDPRGALLLLDRYEQEYPTGTYAAEASVARVDALLEAGQEKEALALLRRLPLEQWPRGKELLVTRGELAAAGGDCRAALDDFGALLDGGAGPALEERALFNRADCRRSTGDEAGAVEDFAAVVARYPEGRFADRARRALRR